MIVPSHLKNKSPRICKCGHLRDEHKSNPMSKLSWPNDCQKCQCSKYMNRKLPTKISLAMMMFGSIFTAFLWFLVIFTYQISISETKPIQIPINDMLTIIVGLVALESLLIFSFAIYPYFTEKNRRSFPIENKGEMT